MSEWKMIDTWWKALLILGVLTSAGAFMFNIEFVEKKHLLGLGIGMILIGFSNWIAQKHNSTIAFGGLLQWKEIKHNPITSILLLIGIVLIFLFGFLLIKSLI